MGKQKPTSAWQTSRPPRDLPKIPSGIAGLDEILEARLDRSAILSGDFTIAPLPAIISHRYHQYAITDEGIQIKPMPGVPKAEAAKSRPREAGRTTRTVRRRS